MLLIILNAAVLTAQAWPTLLLPTANGPALPPRIHGYFHSWDDYVLFVLFIIFTCVASSLISDPADISLHRLEAFARICVTGFLFDPEVSVLDMFSSPYPSHDQYTQGAPSSSGIARQSSLSRTQSITQRFRHFQNVLMRPFAMNPQGQAPSSYPLTETNGHHGHGYANGHHTPSPPFPSSQPRRSGQHRSEGSTSARTRALDVAHRIHSTLRNPPEPTFFSNALRSDHTTTNGTGQPDSISLPFRLSIGHLHEKTQRNVPYLRQSWSRIDFIAIVSFWISFVLAMVGVEQGETHVGIFRAMSVIRTARLLTITSGTTVGSFIKFLSWLLLMSE